jgi:hypothetical protein
MVSHGGGALSQTVGDFSERLRAHDELAVGGGGQVLVDAGRARAGGAEGAELVEELIGLVVARCVQEALEPITVHEAPAHTGLGEDLHGARIGRQGAGLVALDRVGRDADLLAELVLDDGGFGALAHDDAADAGLEQAPEGLAAVLHGLVPHTTAVHRASIAGRGAEGYGPIRGRFRTPLAKASSPGGVPLRAHL